MRQPCTLSRLAPLAAFMRSLSRRSSSFARSFSSLLTSTLSDPVLPLIRVGSCSSEFDRDRPRKGVFVAVVGAVEIAAALGRGFEKEPLRRVFGSIEMSSPLILIQRSPSSRMRIRSRAELTILVRQRYFSSIRTEHRWSFSTAPNG